MRYLVQIHLSESCNLRCRHCYQESSGPSPLLSLDDVRKLLLEAREVMGTLGYDELRVNLTGGEPLLVPNFKEYVSLALEYADHVMILTNGTLVDEKWVEFLRGKGLRVQISLDGTREVHDSIRGKGAFDKAVNGIWLLSGAGIRVSVACTLHDGNYRDIDGIVDVAEEAGAERIWFDRYVPCGNALPMTTEQFITAMSAIAGLQRRKRIVVGMNRALQFLFGDEGVYRCSAFVKSVTVLSDKSVLPCRRMPMVLGNLGNETLAEIYAGHGWLMDKLKNPPPACDGCGYAKRCKGGLRCLSFATCGLDGKDPNCFI